MYCEVKFICYYKSLVRRKIKIKRKWEKVFIDEVGFMRLVGFICVEMKNFKRVKYYEEYYECIWSSER